MLPTTLDNVVVNFDGYAAPLIYVSPGQINAIVPYEISGQTVTNFVVSQQGVSSAPLALRVAATVPAIYSAGQTGSGPGAILNADNSSNNSSDPAAPGSIIQIFATGEGLSEDASTGSITPPLPPFRLPLAPVSVTIGGVTADDYVRRGSTGAGGGHSAGERDHSSGGGCGNSASGLESGR